MRQSQHKISVWLSDALYARIQEETARNKPQGTNLSDTVRQALVQVFAPIEPSEAQAISPVKVLPPPSLEANMPVRDEKAALANLQKW